MITLTSGNNIEYRENGQLHRTDGPALIKADGGQFWYLNGQLHRLEGPAVILASGELVWCVDKVPLRLIGDYLSSTSRFLEYTREFRLAGSSLAAACKLAVYHKLLTKEQAKQIEMLSAL